MTKTICYLLKTVLLFPLIFSVLLPLIFTLFHIFCPGHPWPLNICCGKEKLSTSMTFWNSNGDRWWCHDGNKNEKLPSGTSVSTWVPPHPKMRVCLPISALRLLKNSAAFFKKSACTKRAICPTVSSAPVPPPSVLIMGFLSWLLAAGNFNLDLGCFCLPEDAALLAIRNPQSGLNP